eukprot:CAMPEP_0174309182 /NCGR_PEP_ID=MMETSP0810-20121108/2236_1 /TAXON_ID=73025 ORGANISM="Eutreptiella gymnastica-like, Strain CCMP1594" /NCGR_SAMPLE_ID=MMETSP0810 /ASSEMBLY_ACC=CAM_ASM_000659 /LENGTH=96 /DNA_ID=CAMNT_0015416723 /DNA_START=268 /DNA_END=558 /DNA_ORIENTATION=+
MSQPTPREDEETHCSDADALRNSDDAAMAFMPPDVVCGAPAVGPRNSLPLQESHFHWKVFVCSCIGWSGGPNATAGLHCLQFSFASANHCQRFLRL